MKDRHYLWIVEAKGSSNRWQPCLGFFDGTSCAWLTRDGARKAARHMEAVNSYNQFGKVVSYRAKRYKAEL